MVGSCASCTAASHVEGLTEDGMRFSLTPAWLIETRFMSMDVTRLQLGLGGRSR